eukprot:CAMPEP_0178912794 /NCGR_PEP_ID=MMETSP0786-20121207/10470_1 /TAXON_ID=186022 /ORGANISM="Thalassionema frauenfeldii, Strain CCMP 1798" /LENGTH=85 /DNA_ID=CAMNT_0020585435 /DNA_START=192 /DNA_END=445 /DNA_ORIENTATION=+
MAGTGRYSNISHNAVVVDAAFGYPEAARRNIARNINTATVADASDHFGVARNINADADASNHFGVARNINTATVADASNHFGVAR